MPQAEYKSAAAGAGYRTQINGKPIGEKAVIVIVDRDESQGRSDGAMDLAHSSRSRYRKLIGDFNAVPGATVKIGGYEMGGAIPQMGVGKGIDPLATFEQVAAELPEGVAIRMLWRSLFGDSVIPYHEDDLEAKLRRILTASGALHEKNEAGDIVKPGRPFVIRSFEANDDLIDQEAMHVVFERLKGDFNLAIQGTGCYTPDPEIAEPEYLERWEELMKLGFDSFAIKDMGGFQKPGKGAFNEGYGATVTARTLDLMEQFGQKTGHRFSSISEHMHQIEPRRTERTLATKFRAFLDADPQHVQAMQVDLGAALQSFGTIRGFSQECKALGIDLGILPQQWDILMQMEAEDHNWHDAYRDYLVAQDAMPTRDLEYAYEPSGAVASTFRILVKPVQQRLSLAKLPEGLVADYEHAAYKLSIEIKRMMRNALGRHNSVTPGALSNDRVSLDAVEGFIANGILVKVLEAGDDTPEGWEKRLAALREQTKAAAVTIKNPDVISYFRGRLIRAVDPVFFDHICFAHLMNVLPEKRQDAAAFKDVTFPQGSERERDLAYARLRAALLANPTSKLAARKALKAAGLDKPFIDAFAQLHVGQRELPSNHGVEPKEAKIAAELRRRMGSKDSKEKITVRMPFDHAVHIASMFPFNGQLSQDALRAIRRPSRQFPFHWINPSETDPKGWTGYLDLDRRSPDEVQVIDMVLKFIREYKVPIAVRSIDDIEKFNPVLADTLRRKHRDQLVSLGLLNRKAMRKEHGREGGSWLPTTGVESTGSALDALQRPGIRGKAANGDTKSHANGAGSPEGP